MFIIIIITLSYAFLPPKLNHVAHATELHNLKRLKKIKMTMNQINQSSQGPRPGSTN